MPKTVLFVCSNQNHVRIFSPVARILEREERISPQWIALDRYYNHEAEMVLREYGWTDYRLLPRPEGAFATPWEGGARARMQVLLQGRQAIRAHLRASPPNVVVLGNDLGILERLFIAQARPMGIPSLLVQDGVIALRPMPVAQVSPSTRLVRAVLVALGLRLTDPKPYGQNGADRIAVMGEAVAHWLVQQGVPKERIVSTGQPRYDVLYALRQGIAQPNGLESLHLPLGQRIILFASQPYLRYGMFAEAEAREIWRTVIAGIQGLGAGYHLVAKLHPAEDLEWTRHWLGNDFPPEWTLCRDVDTFSLLYHADALVTLFSSTALEALCLGKPVVRLDMGRLPESIPYAERGAALQASSASELTEHLHRAIHDEATRARVAQAREAFLAAFAGPLDGQASLRVAREIEALVRGKP